MPTYHYQCKSCKHEFEEFQKMSDEPLKVCPACQKHTLVRLLSGGAGIVFKGSGFYLTDYKGKTPSVSQPKSDSAKKPEATAEPKSNAGSTEPQIPKDNSQ